MSEQEIVWTVEPASMPAVFRKCSRCGRKKPFVSTGKFRVNANKRLIDVWLIYGCADCGNTWNCTIHSRQRVNRIDGDLYERFSRNDEELARRYAFDHRLLEANGAEPAPVEYVVNGQELDPDGNAPVTVLLRAEVPVSARVASLLAARLGVSRRQLEAAVESGAVSFQAPEGAGLSSRLQGEMRIRILPAALARRGGAA